MKEDFEAVIGLEIHIQMNTRSKMFCSCPVEYGESPNEFTCPVCTGMPGVLPVINKKAVELALKTALALRAKINLKSILARKNYFYPDLPKNYQISQYENPLAEGGYLIIESENGLKRINLVRVHIEEDAGKLIHTEGEESLVDLNRAGTPLMEIVTRPDISSPKEAGIFLRELRKLMRYLEVSNADMEKGQLRCDANISVRKKGEEKLGKKTEIKNINSFKFVEKALEYEMERQIQTILEGGEIIQETRLFDPVSGKTRSMRSKEEAHDYRYFPEPDLLPLIISQEWIEEIKKEIPEMPLERKMRFMRDYNLTPYDAGILTEDREIADYYEKVIKCGTDPKKASNWIIVEIFKIMKDKGVGIKELKISPENLAELIRLIDEGKISGTAGKEVLQICAETGKKPEEIILEKNMVLIGDRGEIEKIARKIVEANPDEVKKYLSGKDKIIGWFVGQVMKETKGKADPKIVNEIVRKVLDERKKIEG